jgi:hypothetical protein
MNPQQATDTNAYLLGLLIIQGALLLGAIGKGVFDYFMFQAQKKAATVAEEMKRLAAEQAEKLRAEAELRQKDIKIALMKAETEAMKARAEIRANSKQNEIIIAQNEATQAQVGEVYKVANGNLTAVKEELKTVKEELSVSSRGFVVPEAIRRAFEPVAAKLRVLNEEPVNVQDSDSLAVKITANLQPWLDENICRPFGINRTLARAYAIEVARDKEKAAH